MATTAKATKPKPTASKPKKGAVNSGKMLVVTQTGGATGKGPKMQETLIGLGLGRIRSSRELQDTPSIRGMITRVRHLVSVEEKASRD